MYIFQSTCFHELVLHLHSYMNVVLQIMAACVCVSVRGYVEISAWPNLLLFCTYYTCTDNASVLIAFFIFDFHASLSLSRSLIACYGLTGVASLPFTLPAASRNARISASLTSRRHSLLSPWHLLSTFNSCDCAKAFMCVKRANIIWFLRVLHRTTFNAHYTLYDIESRTQSSIPWVLILFSKLKIN